MIVSIVVGKVNLCCSYSRILNKQDIRTFVPFYRVFSILRAQLCFKPFIYGLGDLLQKYFTEYKVRLVVLYGGLRCGR